MVKPCRRYLETIPASRSRAACRRAESLSVFGLSIDCRKCLRAFFPNTLESAGEQQLISFPFSDHPRTGSTQADVPKPARLADDTMDHAPKTDFHYMLDIMAQIPILIDQTERVHKASQSDMSVAKRSELLEQGWVLHLQLKNWYQELRRRFSEPFYIERPSSLSWPNPVPTDLEYVFPTFLHFQTFEIARMHLFYWTALLLLYDNILRTMPPSLDPNKLDSASSSIYPTILPTTDKAAVRDKLWILRH